MLFFTFIFRGQMLNNDISHAVTISISKQMANINTRGWFYVRKVDSANRLTVISSTTGQQKGIKTNDTKDTK